jgi:hypothetical protein
MSTWVLQIHKTYGCWELDGGGWGDGWGFGDGCGCGDGDGLSSDYFYSDIAGDGWGDGAGVARGQPQKEES